MVAVAVAAVAVVVAVVAEEVAAAAGAPREAKALRALVRRQQRVLVEELPADRAGRVLHAHRGIRAVIERRIARAHVLVLEDDVVRPLLEDRLQRHLVRHGQVVGHRHPGDDEAAVRRAADRAVPDAAAVQRVQVVPERREDPVRRKGIGQRLVVVRGRRVGPEDEHRVRRHLHAREGLPVEREREGNRHGRGLVVSQRQPRSAGGRVHPGVRAVGRDVVLDGAARHGCALRERLRRLR